MNAYSSEMDPRRSPPQPVTNSTPSGPSPGPNEVTGGAKAAPKKKVVTSENSYLIPIAFAELIMLTTLIALNVLFRFDPATRDSATLFIANNVTLYSSDVTPARPYFDYSLTLDQNVQANGAYIGISFTMEEYAFFVPVFIFPLLLFILVELINLFARKKSQKTVLSVGITFIQIIRRLFRFYFTFLMFASIAGMVTIFIKLLIAVPRPHFLAVCDISTAFVPEVFAVGMVCTNDSPSAVYEALRSFPSYHATIALYSTAFLCLYLFYACRVRGIYCLSGVLSLPVIVMGLIGALHRWTTFHNTFFDIAWGGLIGIVTAYVAVYGMLNRFKERIWITKKVAEAEQQQQKPDSQEGHVNDSYVPGTPLTRTDLVLTKQSSQYFSFDDQKPMRSVSPQLPPPLPRAPQQTVNGRPTQAFNTKVGNEDDSRRRPQQPNYGPAADYNRPRQRFSIPPPPRAPSAPRPNSAHPMTAYPRSRYEGASYF